MAVFATPFENELCTNYIPSAQDCDQIRNLLIGPKERLTQLNNKIVELEQALCTLKQERDVLDQEIQQHTHLLTGIRRLPDDMLREIFLACVPDNHNAVMSSRGAPLLLGLVCSRWRSLVYSTPSLWASLHIALPSDFPYLAPVTNLQHVKYNEVYNYGRLEKHQTAVRDWLTRSEPYPLSISFHVPLGTSAPYDLKYQPYLDIVLSFSHRWRALEMTIPRGNLSRIMASIPTTSVPILKDLLLEYPNRREDEQWKTSGLLRAPRLRTLDIGCIPFLPSHAPGISWSHLSSLNLTCTFLGHALGSHSIAITIKEAHGVLSRCPRLTHCALEVFDVDNELLDNDRNSISMGPISLPYLRSLVIIEIIYPLSTLFECFSDLSQLRGISYQTTTRSSYRRASSLVTLLTRTSNQLTYLSTNFQAFNLADLTTVFTLVPHLLYLVEDVSKSASQRLWSIGDRRPIESFNFDKVSLNLLVPRGRGEIFCPCLQTLQINIPTNLSDANVVSFIQSRMEASKCLTGNVKPLREFHAVFSRPVELDIRAQLLEYIDNGPLKLSVSYNPTPKPSPPKIDPHHGLMERAVPGIIRVCHNT